MNSAHQQLQNNRNALNRKRAKKRPLNSKRDMCEPKRLAAVAHACRTAKRGTRQRMTKHPIHHATSSDSAGPIALLVVAVDLLAVDLVAVDLMVDLRLLVA